MENFYCKDVMEMSAFQWMWSKKKKQMIGTTLFGLIFVISPLLTLDSTDWLRYAISGFGVIWIFLISFLHPFIIYRSLKRGCESPITIDTSHLTDKEITEPLLSPVVNSSRVKTPKKRIILAGAAGSGKDYLKNRCKEAGLSVDVSLTTRPMREGEIEGLTYQYVSDEEFERIKKIRGFYEFVEFNSAKYGTLAEGWENSDVFIMTPSGISQINRKDRKNCYIVYLDIDEEVRRERMVKRLDNGFDDIERRIKADNEDFEGFENKAHMIITDPFFDANVVIAELLKKKVKN